MESKGLSKTVFRSEKSIVDTETGEIKRLESINTVRLPEEPPYVKLYLDDLVRINDLPKSTSKILYQFVRKMNYDGQIILNAAVKRMIASLINVKEQSISNSITCLIQKDIMQRIDTGIYVLNPTLFAKGAWGDIRKLREKYLELKVTYTPEGKRILASNLKDSI